MARKKLDRVTPGMGGIKGSSKEVNPTFSLKKAPVAKPAQKTQVNPTFSSTGRGHKTGATPRSRVNPTFSVAKSGAETSTGSTGRKLVMAKNHIGNPIATRSNPTPRLATLKSKNNGVTSKLFAIPKRNIKGGVGKGSTDLKPSKTHALKGTHDVSVPTRNEMAPYGPNGTAKAPMTVSRLKKLGY